MSGSELGLRGRASEERGNPSSAGYINGFISQLWKKGCEFLPRPPRPAGNTTHPLGMFLGSFLIRSVAPPPASPA